MNQRIKELALKSGAWHQVYGEQRFLHNHNFDIEQFAKLVVQECAGIYDKIDNGNLHMGTDDYLEALHRTFRS